MRLKTLGLQNEDLQEGVKDFLSSMFFMDPNTDLSSKKKNKNTSEKKQPEIEAAEPFGGVCKFRNSVLIPETSEYRNNPDKLIKAAAQMFRGNWINNKDAQHCLKSVIAHLLSLYLEDYNNNVNDIDMSVIANSIADNKFQYSHSNDDYKMVYRVYKRIKYHKERIFDDMITNPGNFSQKWKDAKTELATVIENVLKTGGENKIFLGRAAARAASKKNN